jgi:small subunit ribosomal protein S16
MKKLGRKHRPFYRICAMEKRTQRDGRILEELGTYDPMIPDTDARVKIDGERVKYWLSVGAQPSDKVSILIKKYGSEGTHLEQQRLAQAKLTQSRRRPAPPQPQTKASRQAAEQAAEAAVAEPDAEAPSAEPSE